MNYTGISNKEQQKIIIVFSITFLVLFLVFLLFYLPFRKEYKELKAKYTILNSEVKSAQKELKNVGGLNKSIDLLDQEYKKYEQKLMIAKEDLVEVLSETAYAKGVKWISYEPKSDEVYQSPNNAGGVVFGSPQLLKIYFEVNGLYENLGEFFKFIEQDFGGALTLLNVDISKMDETKPELKAKCLAQLVYVTQ